MMLLSIEVGWIFIHHICVYILSSTSNQVTFKKKFRYTELVQRWLRQLKLKCDNFSTVYERNLLAKCHATVYTSMSGLRYSKCHSLYFVGCLLLIFFQTSSVCFQCSCTILYFYFHASPVNCEKMIFEQRFKGNLIFKDSYLTRHCSQNSITSSFYSFFISK